jgi:hypothetical protein
MALVLLELMVSQTATSCLLRHFIALDRVLESNKAKSWE